MSTMNTAPAEVLLPPVTSPPSHPPFPTLFLSASSFFPPHYPLALHSCFLGTVSAHRFPEYIFLVRSLNRPHAPHHGSQTILVPCLLYFLRSRGTAREATVSQLCLGVVVLVLTLRVELWLWERSDSSQDLHFSSQRSPGYCVALWDHGTALPMRKALQGPW